MQAFSRPLFEVELAAMKKFEPRAEFSIAQARELIRDLFEPRPWIYWSDFLISAALGMASFVALRRLPWHEMPLRVSAPLVALFYVLSVLSLYRASLFTHELTHLRSGTFGAFRVVWNLMYGIPFLVPSFLYHTHLDHHASRQYGTLRDGEYLPLAHGPRWKIFAYLAESLVVPLVAVGRFLVVPATWFCRPLRRWLAQHASAMVIDPRYVRPLPSSSEIKIWRLQETACFLWVAAIGTLLVGGVIPLGFLLTAYAVSVGVMLINSVRTLGAHRYRSQGEPVTFVEQLLDSVNYPHHALLSELWAPVGLRFHALHHLFPSLPYHNLAAAHRRLSERLPADSPYHATSAGSLLATIGQLWKEAGQGRPRRDATAEAAKIGRAVTA
jgi:fatty acid desaturase